MIEVKVMGNGIRVIMEQMPYHQSISIGVFINAGSVNETPQNNGIAHVIEHMLFKGTTSRSAIDIANDMTMVGGNLDAFTSKDCTCIYVRTLETYIEAAVDIVADMLQNSVFDEEDLKKELGVILEEMDMYDDSPEDLVHEQLQKAVWKDHPLGYIISGEKRVVRNFTRQQVLEFFEEHYVGENMMISIAGAFDPEKMMELFERSFAGIKRGRAVKEVKAPIYHPTLWFKQKDIEQVHLDIAYDSCVNDSPDRYALTIANSILGGNMNSKLFMEIRENLGLTYAIYSYGSSYNQAGLFQIYAAMNPSQTQAVIENIQKVIDQMKEKPLKPQEMQMALAQIETELIIGSESSYDHMLANAKSMMIRNRVATLEEDLSGLRAVTAADIQALNTSVVPADS